MTKPKAKALGARDIGELVWFEAELVPDPPNLEHALDGLPINSLAFSDWLVPRLAEYRAHARGLELRGQRSAIVEWMTAAELQIGEALKDGRLQRPPKFFAEPAIWYAAHKMGLEWESVLGAQDHELIVRVLHSACESLKRQNSRRGRPPMFDRDVLLRAIVEELKRSVPSLLIADAQLRADLVLRACGVPSPEESVARATRRPRKI